MLISIESPENSMNPHPLERSFLLASLLKWVNRTNTEFDFIDVTGDLILDGGVPEVELINDFEITADLVFVIARVGDDI